jgi:hypothetical protein
VNLSYTFSVSSYARLEGLTVTLAKIPVFLIVALYHCASIYLTSPHGTYCLLLQVQAILFLDCWTLKIKALRPFRKSQTTTPAKQEHFTEDLTGAA